MEIGPRVELKPFDGCPVTMRRINGKRFLFFRYETETHVVFHVTNYSTRHWINFPKDVNAD